jgi:hypothetical protein
MHQARHWHPFGRESSSKKEQGQRNASLPDFANHIRNVGGIDALLAGMSQPGRTIMALDSAATGSGGICTASRHDPHCCNAL